MTSRLRTQTALQRIRFLGVLAVAAALGACAALPDDSPVVEQLDPDTGATIARLGRPIELYRDTFVQDATGRFAFIGPFETNQMGTRETFLWLAVPIEAAQDAEPPTVEVNGKPLALGAMGRGADFAALRGSPYKIPTPWSSMYYFKLDAALLAQLGAANDLAIRVLEPTKDGAVPTTFTAKVADDPRLRGFAAR
jgi:hypothetical protein